MPMQPRKAVSNLVRRYFRAYEAKDRKAIESLLTEDFTFSSPLDARIDRAGHRRRWSMTL
jgi:hypothetical protein